VYGQVRLILGTRCRRDPPKNFWSARYGARDVETASGPARLAQLAGLIRDKTRDWTWGPHFERQ
jgi:hypothetical protein